MRGLEDHNNPYFSVTGAYIGATERTRRYPPPVVAFRPFSLAPGHTRWIEVRFRFRNCSNATRPARRAAASTHSRSASASWGSPGIKTSHSRRSWRSKPPAKGVRPA